MVLNCQLLIPYIINIIIFKLLVIDKYHLNDTKPSALIAILIPLILCLRNQWSFNLSYLDTETDSFYHDLDTIVSSEWG
jgi:hypothetical protein